MHITQLNILRNYVKSDGTWYSRKQLKDVTVFMFLVHKQTHVHCAYASGVLSYNIDTIFTFLIMLSVIIKSVQERIKAMNINKTVLKKSI